MNDLLNAMTVDVEDWYQVSAFEDVVSRADWPLYESRVVRNTGLVLDVLASRRVHATFFTLGWVAERHPALLREIRDRGHEIASHGFDHRLATTFTPDELRADLRRAADAIEAACGVRPRGYRAPSFSIARENLWVHEVLRDEGYTFSSSVFPVAHDRYGIPDFPRRPVRLQGPDGRAIWEFPLTTRRFLGANRPVAGGGWLRLLPGWLMRRALAAEIGDGVPVVVYLHPWELDPDQPTIASASWKARTRHRLNLRRTRARLERLLDTFRFGTMSQALTSHDPSFGVAPGSGAPRPLRAHARAGLC